jgi:hypothetical protein
LTDFKPDANDIRLDFNGTGAAGITDGSTDSSCYKNLVCQIDSNRAILSLIFSHGIPHFSPIQEFGLSPGLSIVGTGQCKDSGGNGYAYAYRSVQAFDLNDAYEWCKTANNYASKLVAVEVGTNARACLYQKGDVNGMEKTDFDPIADGLGDGPGTGVTANGKQGNICLKNEVRRIDFNRIISFLIFSHSICKFSCLIS